MSKEFEPTPTMVKDFWKHMQRKFQFQIADKSQSSLMKLAAWFLNLLGIQDKQDFLDTYTTTIFSTIYIPFKIGVASEPYPLPNQISICVHEAAHVLQNASDRRFTWRYATSTSWRANYEAKAYRTNMEIYWWYTKELLDPRMLAEKLWHYGCKEGDILACQQNLEIAAKMVKRGGVVSETSKVALKWLNKHATGYKGKGAPLIFNTRALKSLADKTTPIRTKGTKS